MTEDLEKSPSVDPLQLLRQQQNLIHALVGGVAATIVSALIWATITVLTNYQIGYMAILIGILVGFSIRYFGNGIDQVYGIIGALLALIGCALGNLLSQIAFISQSESLEYIEVISLLNLDLIINIYAESFAPMDVLFYGIAAYEGYKFAFRPITEELLAQAKINSLPEIPYAKYRFHAMVMLFTLLFFGGYFLLKEKDFEKTYKYDSGAMMSKGHLVDGKENGLWNYWWENGQKQAEGNYVNGKQDSVWQYYDEDGKVSKSGVFKSGFENGKWTTYYSDGKVSSVSDYRLGRLNGEYISYYEDGSINQKGIYNADLLNGKLESYFPNKQLNFSGSYKNNQPIGQWTYWHRSGKVSEEFLFEKESIKIINAWDSLGNQSVKDGNGVYKTFHLNGNVFEVGNVKDAHKSGLWKKYSDDGKLNEDGEYRNDVYYINNIWNADGQLMIEKGNGKYTYTNAVIFESGNIKQGQRTGEWITKISENDSIPTQRINYKNGKLEGIHESFFDTGEINIKGLFKNNERDGEWTWYYKNGNIETVVTFENGIKEGLQPFFDEEGNKTKTEVYKKNELIDVKIE